MLILETKKQNQIECVDWKAEGKEWYMKSLEEGLLTGSKLPNMPVWEAKLNELHNWKKYKAYEEVPANEQKTISVLWVSAEKDTEEGKVTKVCLVARGYEEEEACIERILRLAPKKVYVWHLSS